MNVRRLHCGGEGSLPMLSKYFAESGSDDLAVGWIELCGVTAHPGLRAGFLHGIRADQTA